MKYWRGYLTAAILAVFTGALMQFAKSHAELIDMVYPYITRLVQTVLADWSGGVAFCVWQVLAVALVLVLIVTVILMIVLRWNPIQWFGWVLAAAALVFFLHTGVYGLNTYAGPIAEDLHLQVSEYTLSELTEAAQYYRDEANKLAGQVSRDASGKPDFGTFEEMAAQAGDGFTAMTIEQYQPVFAGSTRPVKKLGFSDLYTKMGITGFTFPLTGEAAVNPDIPALGLPFTMSHEMAHRMCIASERDANFAAFLACRANSSADFRYSAFFMAYRYCYNALISAGAASQAQQLSSGVGDQLRQDLSDYQAFFAEKQDRKATAAADRVNDTYLKTSGDARGVASYGDVCDLLVSLYLQEHVVPKEVVEEPSFDPTDRTQVDVSDIVRNAA